MASLNIATTSKLGQTISNLQNTHENQDIRVNLNMNILENNIKNAAA